MAENNHKVTVARDLEDLGKHIEDGARSGDRASLEAAITDYADYLGKVQIEYE